MGYAHIKLLISTLCIFFISTNISAQRNVIERFEKVKKDSVANAELRKAVERYNQVPDTNRFSAPSDMEDVDDGENPADDLYKNVWTRDRLNPYQTSPNDLPDSVYIDVSGFTMPLDGDIKVNSGFGPRWRRMHYGTDLHLQIGDTVRAAFAGKIRIVDYEPRGYGNYVVIRHNNGLETVYGHMSRVLVVEDQTVQAGEAIGLGGSTGRSTGPHLHFEFRYLGNAFDTEHVVNFQSGVILTDSLLLTKTNSFNYSVQSPRQYSSASVKYYTVRKGDTLGKIASRYGISVRNLAKINHIATNKKLSAGQRLRVK